MKLVKQSKLLHKKNIYLLFMLLLKNTSIYRCGFAVPTVLGAQGGARLKYVYKQILYIKFEVKHEKWILKKGQNRTQRLDLQQERHYDPEEDQIENKPQTI